MTCCSSCNGFLSTLKDDSHYTTFECNGCGKVQMMKKELKSCGSTWQEKAGGH